jgi:transcriptional regulator with XRE-family HTH domain
MNENKFEKEGYIKKLADRIRALRTQKGYASYENFAFDKELPRAQYGRYEKGEDIRFSSLVKLVQAFDMTLEEFFSEGFD